jgi:triacylglycerol esterase/lipase EstA (alpha/beta hydrolase family)
MDESTENESQSLGLHLIVLVHGFQGNSYDMRLIKNIISLVNPSCVFLSSTSNQDDTEGDFTEMGKKLANEVRSFIKEWNEGVIFKKISFIGHSIGGLIIRSCLPYLRDFSTRMWLYMSLSTPHLGYIYTTSKIIEAGMWLIKTWKKAKSLEQLSFSDSKNIKDSLVYKLSEYDGLNWFSHVYLLSSHQDYYAPFESTRIQICRQSLEEDR